MYAHLSSPPGDPQGQELALQTQIVAVNGVELDAAQRRLRKGGSSTNLTRKECDLLRLLMTCAGQPVSNRILLHSIWRGPAARNIGHVRTLVRQLRKKIEDDPAQPRYVQTVSEVGYVFGAVSSAPDVEQARDAELAESES
jgi:two-component system KDP operon response regulator KdpE